MFPPPEYKMNDRSSLFLDAFGGESEKRQESDRSVSPFSPDERAAAFVTAFGSSNTKELPVANRGVGSWRINTQKMAKLSFQEQWALGELKDVPYQELPAWILDGGFAVPSKEEAKLQKDLNAIDGYTTVERKEAFDVFAAEVNTLSEMASREVLRNSSLILNEYHRVCDRFGTEEVNRALAETSPEAFQHFRVIKAEQKALQEATEAQAKASEESIRKELQAAADAIQKMGGDVPAEMSKLDAQTRGTEVID